MNDDIAAIKKVFAGKVCAFTGQSGAGKSTLLNRISPNLKLKTGEISLALNRGKHTTRHTELIELCDGMVADTPGFSALEFTGMSKEDIRIILQSLIFTEMAVSLEIAFIFTRKSV